MRAAATSTPVMAVPGHARRTASAIEVPMRPAPTTSSRAGGGPPIRSTLRRRQRAQPRRASGSVQMLRPIAGAMIRSSAISRSNCTGNIDCAPSESA